MYVVPRFKGTTQFGCKYPSITAESLHFDLMFTIQFQLDYTVVDS